MTPKRIATTILKASVSISLMFWVVHSSGIESIRDAFDTVNIPLFILAVLCFAGSGAQLNFHAPFNDRYQGDDSRSSATAASYVGNGNVLTRPGSLLRLKMPRV